MKRIVHTEKAPKAIGSYSQAVHTAGGLLFISGQIPLVPETGAFAADDIAGQTTQCLENIKVILEAAGGSLANVVKTTVLLQNINDFAAMNEVYARYFTQECPARAAVAVAALPKGALVEIEAVAELGN